MGEAMQGWADATIAGFRAMGLSRYAEAAGHWLAAREMQTSGAAGDPRHAACQSNTGVAHILLRQPREAAAALAEAERSWTQISSDVATWDIAVPGLSSSFHFRLASRNLPAFQDAQRRRHSKRSEAGLAITRLNRLFTGAGPGADGANAPALASQLADLLGPRSPEVRLLRPQASPSPETASPDSPYAEIADAAMREGSALTAPTDDTRRLEVAVALTVLLRPGLSFEHVPT